MRSETPLICDLTAMNNDQRARHQAVLQELREAVQEMRDLTDGYAFRLLADRDRWKMAAEFVSLERLPVSRFQARPGGRRRSLWLRLTGREGVKAFPQAELSLSHRLTGP